MQRHAQSQTRPRQNCLIVEDSDFDQQHMMRVLRNANLALHPLVVSTLRDARRALSENPVAIILLDNNLPDGKGANFALELAGHAVWGNIPVIIVSDWPSPFMYQKATVAGVGGVVSKSEFVPDLIERTLGAAPRVH